MNLDKAAYLLSGLLAIMPLTVRGEVNLCLDENGKKFFTDFDCPESYASTKSPVEIKASKGKQIRHQVEGKSGSGGAKTVNSLRESMPKPLLSN